MTNLDGLSKADITDIRKAIVKAKDWIEALKRGESCGMDCQAQMAEATMALDFLMKVNNLYGPQFPTKQ
jgi:hypothetical protein